MPEISNAPIESASKILSNFHKNIPAAGRADVLKDVDRNVIVKRNADIHNAENSKSSDIPKPIAIDEVAQQFKAVSKNLTGGKGMVVSLAAGAAVGYGIAVSVGIPVIMPIIIGSQTGALLNHLYNREPTAAARQNTERHASYLAMTTGIAFADILAHKITGAGAGSLVTMVSAMTGYGLARLANLTKPNPVPGFSTAPQPTPKDVNLLMLGIAVGAAGLAVYNFGTINDAVGSFALKHHIINDPALAPNVLSTALYYSAAVAIGLTALHFGEKFLKGPFRLFGKAIRWALVGSVGLVAISAASVTIGAATANKRLYNPGMSVLEFIGAGASDIMVGAGELFNFAHQKLNELPSLSLPTPVATDQFIKCGFALVIPDGAPAGTEVPVFKDTVIHGGTPFFNNAGKEYVHGTVKINGEKEIGVLVEKEDITGQNCRTEMPATPVPAVTQKKHRRVDLR